MPKERAYEELLSVIQVQESELDQLRHRLGRSEGLLHRYAQRTCAIERLATRLLAESNPQHMHDHATDAVVSELGWDTGLVVALDGTLPVVRSAAQVTQGQLRQLYDQLGRDRRFPGLYAKREPLSTMGSRDPDALSLRTLFQTDEVAAQPVVFEDQLHGYLIGCGHTRDGRERTHEDLDFLGVIASLLGRALPAT